MNTEEIVIGLIGDYKFAGLSENNVEERTVFLAVLAFILVSKTHECYLDEALLRGLEWIFEGNIDVAFLKQSHQELFDELKGYYQQSKSVLVHSLQNLKYLIEAPTLHRISPLTALKIYDRTLQRLQKMNVEDRYSKSFQYDYFPLELAQLAVSAVDSKKQLRIYEPVSEEGKLAIFSCALSKADRAFVVAEKQSPSYVTHMLTIAGVSSSQTPEKRKKTNEKFDLSVLLQPIHLNTAKTFDIEGHISDQINSLDDEGVAVAFVGHGFLTGKQHKKFREGLISRANVKAVIELPEKLLNRTTPTLFALLLSKRSSSKQISFWDLSDQFESRGRVNALMAEKVLTSENAISVSTVTVLSRDSSLAPRSYLELSPYAASTETNDARKKLVQLQEKNDQLLSKLFE